MVRIALCDLPTLVEDILTVLLADVPGVLVVGRVARVADADADLVICALEDAEMDALWRGALPPAILNLGPDSARGDIYAVRSVHERLDGLTARTLRAAVQAQAR